MRFGFPGVWTRPTRTTGEPTAVSLLLFQEDMSREKTYIKRNHWNELVISENFPMCILEANEHVFGFREQM